MFVPSLPMKLLFFTPGTSMRLVNYLLGALLLILVISASSSSSATSSARNTLTGTGLRNRKNICYMNALLSCLHDVTPFRKAVYEHYEESVLIHAIAGVFGRKQLNFLPSLDLEGDMMETVEKLVPIWEFGTFQDIDEFLKLIFTFFPPSITNIIGYEAQERLTTSTGGYIINEGIRHRIPMVTVHLPDRPSSGGSLNLQHLINAALSGVDQRDYTIHRVEHPQFFEENPETTRGRMQVLTTINVEQRVNEYADVVPVFIPRRTSTGGSSRQDFRTDSISNAEMITFPIHDGRSAEFTLTGFAVYRPGHYYAYTKHFPTREWLCYNDAQVTAASGEEVLRDLQNNAVMLFYVKRGASVATVVPRPIQNWSVTSMIVQHMRDSLARRVKKMMKKSRK